MIRRSDAVPLPVPRALIVDPDPDTRALHALALQPFFHVEEAEDGAEALARAILRQPALVVTELRLPRVDGYALCSMLRKEPATRGTAILVVTASAWPPAGDRARHAGADHVLLKPCRPDDVVERACSMLRARDGGAGEEPPPAAAVEADDRTRSASRRFVREVTTTPPQPPPSLRCPSCDRLLEYQHSYVGGVSATRREQWDHYSCAACGAFAYRHRVRRLQRVQDPAAPPRSARQRGWVE